ncbi:HAD family hydrolase [Pseudalkalibacillus caeni]|uniref:HAD family hydrolase n=1 Tax=Exobacillus caeni TaxID=2574798 RepID=A0A5R9F514_9BACL|nr:HAD family hydrolase [Pseudalkalibacillus caeni]TLS38121.1 HAD family hydrolase [Pseudalkalibacillus caeni]
MKDLIDDAKLIIFDLDGTLYEDTDHFDYYGNLMKERLPDELQERFEENYQRMKAGEHIVSIGKAYDIQRDTVLTLDPLSLEVVQVHNWDATEWSKEEVEKTYSDKLVFDFESMIAIGDGWWLPYVTGRHFGLSVKETYACYIATKEYMVTDEFQLTKTPGLKEGLHQLKDGKQLVLMTNSDADDVERLLNELDLDGIFHHKITSALKPANTEKHFQTLLETYNLDPKDVLSIGDNFINEIAPALSMGMKALFIQPHRPEVEHKDLSVIHSMEEVFNN